MEIKPRHNYEFLFGLHFFLFLLRFILYLLFIFFKSLHGCAGGATDIDAASGTDFKSQPRL